MTGVVCCYGPNRLNVTLNGADEQLKADLATEVRDGSAFILLQSVVDTENQVLVFGRSTRERVQFTKKPVNDRYDEEHTVYSVFRSCLLSVYSLTSFRIIPE